MGFYGKWETWKVVYNPPILNGTMGVAFVQAGDKAHAMQVFREQYSGKFSTVDSIEKV